MEHTRPDDLNHGTVKITREIPLPWLIGAVVAFVLNVGLMYVTQRENTLQWANQVENQKEFNKNLTNNIVELTRKIDAVIGEGNAKFQRDLQQDAEMKDLSRRITVIENQKALK